jgi:hypothetical protein
VVILVAVVLVGMICSRAEEPNNYVVPVDSDSAEVKTAELLSDSNSVFLFQYATSEAYQTLSVYMSEYQNGTLIQKDTVADISLSPENPLSEGVIAFVPDYKNCTLKIVLADKGAKTQSEFGILENVEASSDYVRSATSIEKQTTIAESTEQGLLALIFDRDTLSAIPISEMEAGDTGSENDYMYYFTFEFRK